ncbi:hypothetical protein EDD18DRAFT_1348794 [Armillaria luteobubalina]|uniref:Uncharacterized protein n=1 Tax=Armillaria luteobubalina TaxID=153913 RepID=A0AA39URN4_9AGAR|nr:hypothetical protein EDD18DRAFT_1348794 [Armillaria luteobubalina]
MPDTPSESNTSSSTDFPFAGSAPDPSNDLACSLDTYLFPASTPIQNGRLEGDAASGNYGLFAEHSFSMRTDSRTMSCTSSDSLSVFDVPSSYAANYQTAPSNEAHADTELYEAEKQHYFMESPFNPPAICMAIGPTEFHVCIIPRLAQCRIAALEESKGLVEAQVVTWGWDSAVTYGTNGYSSGWGTGHELGLHVALNHGRR